MWAISKTIGRSRNIQLMASDSSFLSIKQGWPRGGLHAINVSAYATGPCILSIVSAQHPAFPETRIGSTKNHLQHSSQRESFIAQPATQHEKHNRKKSRLVRFRLRECVSCVSVCRWLHVSASLSIWLRSVKWARKIDLDSSPWYEMTAALRLAYICHV